METITPAQETARDARRAKFSKGPWLLAEYGINNQFPAFTMVKNRDGDNLAKIFVEGEVGIANSHLIAAAPDLVKALQICADWFCFRSNGVENGMQLEPGDVARIVKAALAKATPETEQAA